MQTLLVANRKGGVGKTMVSVTLAAALAHRGHRVAIADADAQQSALGWLSLRPGDRPAIRGLAWEKSGQIGDVPKKLDWLVIDAPGALKGSRAEKLVAEAKAVFVPVQPGLFDRASTERFLSEIDEIKRVAKGKVGVHLIANRLRPGRKGAEAIDALSESLARPVAGRIPERTAYGDMAAEGLSIFDSSRVAFRRLQEDWLPALSLLDG
ncbi:MAG: ParA family protein [Pseudomonadota bacterium]